MGPERTKRPGFGRINRLPQFRETSEVQGNELFHVCPKGAKDQFMRLWTRSRSRASRQHHAAGTKRACQRLGGIGTSDLTNLQGIAFGHRIGDMGQGVWHHLPMGKSCFAKIERELLECFGFFKLPFRGAGKGIAQGQDFIENGMGLIESRQILRRPKARTNPTGTTNGERHGCSDGQFTEFLQGNITDRVTCHGSLSRRIRGSRCRAATGRERWFRSLAVAARGSRWSYAFLGTSATRRMDVVSASN